MILALDIGNSQIHGGVFALDDLRVQFRTMTQPSMTSDDLGVFLRTVLRENNVDPGQIRHVALCSVVPDLLHSTRNCSVKYFNTEPFVLQAGSKTGLKIKYRNPLEVGADRIANAIAAIHLFPEKNVIIVDFGTATTYCAVSAQREYLGGIIIPGLRTSMEALVSKTAKLPKVPIVQPDTVIGRSTIESIQSGLYYGQLAMVRELTRQLRETCFSDGSVTIIGTGGFARLFEQTAVFDAFIPDLVLQGLKFALKLAGARGK